MKSIIKDLEVGLSTICNQFRQYTARKGGYEAIFGYIKGLLCKLDRKNSWQLAESVGSITPYNFQHMLNRGSFDEEGARDHNQTLVVESLGEDNGVWIVDETGFLKKGVESAGVKRQYSGTAGRVENCQIGVFSSYATQKGHALIDRELYIPSEWVADKERSKKAGIELDQKFYTKPELATIMYNRFINNSHKAAWVTGDEAYGRDPEFKKNLDNCKQPYVLAIPRDTRIRIGLLTFKAEDWLTRKEVEWHRLSCGAGAKGQRMYDWGWLKTSERCVAGFAKYLLVRRSISDPTDYAFYTAFTKVGSTLQDVINVAGIRWTIEECFEISKGETGLDQYEVRTKKGWYRHITLSMIASTILTITRAELLTPNSNDSLGEFKKKRQKMEGLYSLQKN